MRMSISVPDDLRAKMEAMDERINWSHVASKAFAAEVWANDIGKPHNVSTAEKLGYLFNEIERLKEKAGCERG